MNVNPKVSAGVGAAGLSAPLAVVVAWGLGLLGVEMPQEVAMSLASLFAALGSGVAGWLVPSVSSN